MELNYTTVGNLDSKQTIVFLHEGLGCVEMWKDFPKELCLKLDFKGFVYDRAGYGKSKGSLKKRTANYLHEAAKELEAFISALQIQNPIIYGHSEGGSIALIYTSLNNSNVKLLISEAGHVFNEEATIHGVRAARPLLAEGKMDGLAKYHGTRFKEVFNAWNDIWLDESFRQWNIEYLLPKITCPLLAIQGMDDQYGTFNQLKSIQENTSRHTKISFLDSCGHAPHKEQKTLVIEEIVSFANEHL